MSHILIAWDNPEKTVVRLTLYSGWSWPELYEENKTIIEMMSSTTETVHLLVDTTQIETVPMGGVITHARNIFGAYPPNCDMRILVTRNLLFQRLASIFQSTFRANLGKSLYSVTSVDEAYRLMNKQAQLQREPE
jgi:hypothetical protein